jgi:hypothetical protein
MSVPTSGLHLVCVVPSAFFGLAGVCVSLTMGWSHTDWTYFAFPATEMFCVPFVELLELVLPSARVSSWTQTRGRENFELEWVSRWGDRMPCLSYCTLRLPDIFGDMLYLTLKLEFYEIGSVRHPSMGGGQVGLLQGKINRF